MAGVMTAGLLTGCGNTEETVSTSDNSAKEAESDADTAETEAAETDAAESDAAETDATETDAAETDASETADAEEFEEANITVALLSFSPLDSSATDAIEEKINEMTQKDLNITVDLQWYDAGTYPTQIPMMIQAGDTLDLFMYVPSGGTTFSSLLEANQLMDVTDILDEYGQNITAALGDFLLGTTKSGRIYGIPNNSCYASSEGILMRKDILDQVGMTEKAESASSWSDIEEIYKAVAANTDLSPVINGDVVGTVANPRPYLNSPDNFSDCKYTDSLGDDYNMFMVDEDTDTVSCYFTSDDYKKTIERIRNWYEEGLIYKDAAISQNYSDTLIKSGIGFSRIGILELGSKEASESTTGYDLVQVDITPAEITTASTRKFGFAVPVTSEEPEAAIRFLDYLYQSQEATTTLAWGLEGRDWILNDDGLCTYPEGVTNDTATYHIGDFLYGNQQMVIPWEGSSATLREDQQAANDAAVVSKYMGFSVDGDALTTEVTACRNIVTQYQPALNAGSDPDWEASFDEMCSKLEAAGINDIIAAYQEQLDAWLAEK